MNEQDQGDTQKYGLNGTVEAQQVFSQVPSPSSPKINPAKTIKKLLKMRSKAGADTPAGHHCSNISELYQNKAKAVNEEQLRQLAASETRQWSGLAATRNRKAGE